MLLRASATSVHQGIIAKIRTTSFLTTILAIMNLATTDRVSRASAFAVERSSPKILLTMRGRKVEAHFIRSPVQIVS